MKKAKKKLLIKLWALEFQWKSPEDYEKYSWNASKRVFPPGWQPYFSKYIDKKHAKHKLNKEINSYLGEVYFRGRNWRIKHKNTKEIISLKIEGKTIILI